MRLAFVVPFFCLAVGGCFDPTDVEGTETEAGTAGEGGSEASGDGDDGSGGAADTSTGAAADPCPEYCTLVNDHCEGDHAQYSGQSACESVCAAMPEGTPDDQLGNTVGCRTFHAINAAEDPDTHCVHAGPAGAGVCGGSCESFCSLALQLCTGDAAQWADVEACLGDCEQFPDDVPFSEGQTTGDTFACRLYHLSLAGLQPDPHCSHIGLVSDTCTPT